MTPRPPVSVSRVRVSLTVKTAHAIARGLDARCSAAALTPGDSRSDAEGTGEPSEEGGESEEGGDGLFMQWISSESVGRRRDASYTTGRRRASQFPPRSGA